MKAAFYRTYGPPSVISVEETQVPVPKENELLVKVHASTVNRTDTGMRTASYFVSRFFTGLFKPKLQISGTDFSGVVEDKGSEVTRFNVGDRIWGFNDEGLQSHAEYMCIKENQHILPIPEGISFEQATASPEGAHYAINFMNKVDMNEGDKVMVYGASGAIGSAMVQLLKDRKIYVTAVCGTKHIDLIKTLGPDKVIDYQTSDFTQDDERYHYVFDAVGKRTFGVCKKLLCPKGVYISSELGPYGQNIYLSLFTPLFGGKHVKFPLPKDIKTSMNKIQTLLEKGAFYPVIDETYPIGEITDAFEYALSGKKVGNIIINMNQKSADNYRDFPDRDPDT